MMLIFISSACWAYIIGGNGFGGTISVPDHVAVLFSKKRRLQSLMDKFVVNSIQCQFGVFLHTHFGHYACAVGADGFDA